MGKRFLFALCCTFVMAMNAHADESIKGSNATEPRSHHALTAPVARRVPAEWEPQEAIWLQWPGEWEKTYEEAFAAFSCIIIQYENVKGSRRYAIKHK